MKVHNTRDGLVKYIRINELLNDILREMAGNEPDEDYIRGRTQKLSKLIVGDNGNAFGVDSAVGDEEHMMLFQFHIVSVPTDDFFDKLSNFDGGDDDE